MGSVILDFNNLKLMAMQKNQPKSRQCAVGSEVERLTRWVAQIDSLPTLCSL